MKKMYKFSKSQLILCLCLCSLLGRITAFLFDYCFNQGALSGSGLISCVVGFSLASVYFYGLFLSLSHDDKTQAFDPTEEMPSLEALDYKPLSEPEYLSEDFLNVVFDVIEVKYEDGVYWCLLDPGVHSEYTGSYYACFTEEVFAGEMIRLTDKGSEKVDFDDNRWSYKPLSNLTLLPKPVTDDA